MSRLTKEQSKEIREHLSDGASITDICKWVGCEPKQIYPIKQQMKKESEDESEETKTEELASSDPDFWKVRYLEAHAILVEHGLA